MSELDIDVMVKGPSKQDLEIESLRTQLARANEIISALSLETDNAITLQAERNQLKRDLAKANERVRELEAHNALLMQASWEMKEGKPDAFYKIKDARNTEPSDALNKFAIEQQVEVLYSAIGDLEEIKTSLEEGIVRNSLVSAIGYLKSKAEQLRKEQE